MRKITSVLFTLLILNHSPLEVSAAASSPSGSVSVEAQVAELPLARFTLRGYTSPQAVVTLRLGADTVTTTANDQGEFVFTERVAPTAVKEICVNSTDRTNRQSVPVCIPTPPRIEALTPVGPILLPPTLSTEWRESQLIITGESIPNAVVASRFTKVLGQNKALKLVPEAHALFLFAYLASSSGLGRFSFSLPEPTTGQFRLASLVHLGSLASPPSAIISFGSEPKSGLSIVLLLIAIVLLLITAVFFVKMFLRLRGKKDTPSLKFHSN